MKRKLHGALLAGALAFCAGAHAELPSYMDWSVGAASDGSGVYAVTSNESGSIFGQACSFNGNCEYRLLTATACEPNAVYPGLVTTEHGAASVSLICRSAGDRGDHVFAIAPFADIDALAKKASRMGIVIPTESDHFHVTRFSMMGATAAVTFMREAIARSLDGAPVSRRVRAARDMIL
ncbi:MAG: hypothetical protein M9951_00650 [Burkholderiaceae bacterium]|jgi:hypothetical protein|nr:hypothetical protein [Burkholderiaceae bacterium]MEB2317364.1 hypothetical protein [Pseudomonadota bacterium]